MKELKTALKQRMGEKNWLDSSTREHAVAKVDSINDFIGYPDVIFNNTFLDNFYAGVSELGWS